MGLRDHLVSSRPDSIVRRPDQIKRQRGIIKIGLPLQDESSQHPEKSPEVIQVGARIIEPYLEPGVNILVKMLHEEAARFIELLTDRFLHFLLKFLEGGRDFLGSAALLMNGQDTPLEV